MATTQACWARRRLDGRRRALSLPLCGCLYWFSFTGHYGDEFVWTVVLIYADVIAVTMLLVLCAVLALETLQTDITVMMVAELFLWLLYSPW